MYCTFQWKHFFFYRVVLLGSKYLLIDSPNMVTTVFACTMRVWVKLWPAAPLSPVGATVASQSEVLDSMCCEFSLQSAVVCCWVDVSGWVGLKVWGIRLEESLSTFHGEWKPHSELVSASSCGINEKTLKLNRKQVLKKSIQSG